MDKVYCKIVWGCHIHHVGRETLVDWNHALDQMSCSTHPALAFRVIYKLLSVWWWHEVEYIKVLSTVYYRLKQNHIKFALLGPFEL